MRKKEYIGCLFVLMSLYTWVLAGCGSRNGFFYETAQDADTAGVYADAVSEGDEDRNARGGFRDAVSEDTVAASDAGFHGVSENAADPADAQPMCYVHICGAVVYPGVYEVPEGSRLYEVITAAGGLCADACDHLVNQAQTVADGMQVYIPTVSEAQEGMPEQNFFAGNETGTQEEAGSRDTRIDLNRATKEQLMTLPGVGETRAQAIIAYREAHGGFASIEELMEVSGIKQGVYDRLKEMIKV